MVLQGPYSLTSFRQIWNTSDRPLCKKSEHQMSTILSKGGKNDSSLTDAFFLNWVQEISIFVCPHYACPREISAQKIVEMIQVCM